LDFYKKYSDSNINESEDKIKEAKHFGVNLFEKIISLDEILLKLSKDCLIICLIDWSIINGRNDYQGHFVPIVGYDNENVIIHNQGLNSPEKFMSVRKEIFEKSRKAVGTDEDIIFVYRKH
jgi:hypothetical protein